MNALVRPEIFTDSLDEVQANQEVYTLCVILHSLKVILGTVHSEYKEIKMNELPLQWWGILIHNFHTNVSGCRKMVLAWTQ